MKEVFFFWSHTFNNNQSQKSYVCFINWCRLGNKLVWQNFDNLVTTDWIIFLRIEMINWFQQLGLSFIVPFLNIPFGGGSSILYEGNNNFGTSTSPFGSGTSSLLGINSGTIIIAIVVGMAAIFLIPMFIYNFTGINTSPYGRSMWQLHHSNTPCVQL